MPPRTTKRKSAMSEMSVDGPSFAAPEPQAGPSNSSRTPSAKSPSKTVAKGISLAQKQAILDNLQEEITVRARRLRAQYGTQAESLRTRVEFRVNRIPSALRKQKLGDLFKKHSDEPAKPSGSQTTAAARNALQESQGNSRTNTHSPENSRKNKRPSDEISDSTDKENEDISNPKKRLRGPPVAASVKATHADIQPSQILSPKSSNSHLQPKAQPTRKTPAGKSQLARPVSPLKPAVSPVKPTGASGIINNMMERAKSTRAGGAAKKTAPPPTTTTTTGAGRGGRKAPVPRAPTRTGKGRASTASESSNLSSGTTIVKKAAAAAKKVPAKRTVMSTIKGIGGAGKKAAAPKAAAPATAGRVLRKRN